MGRDEELDMEELEGKCEAAGLKMPDDSGPED